ncbi:alpha/beta fold hydrolase [Modicisalibacter radicis]|uniref:alpha/beta fold hydrolase n=1 Tax=Halomonas sp. EAR18 TaxID=2518972 RepID=UPI00109CEE46|nr:alpha/beta hydrolase [Halomonas sp. EAR18]
MTINPYRQALINKIEASVTESHVSAGSINTAYLSSGSGQPLILLHGGGAGAVSWYPSIAALSKHFRVIAPDIVGYGESDKPNAAYDKAYFCKWLKDFLSALDIPKAHIVGLSQGGAIALQFVLNEPQMVDKLVLVDAGGLGAKPPFASLFSMILMNSFPSSVTDWFFSRYILFNPKNRDPNHASYSIDVLKRAGGQNAFKQGRGSAVVEIPHASLRKIQNKALVIWGENDRLFPIEYGQNSAAQIPNAEFLSIKDAGHLPLMDQTHIFNKSVIDFLS